VHSKHPFAFSAVNDKLIQPLQFVEDEGDVVFFKNAQGLAQMRPVFSDPTANDSGIEMTLDEKL